MPATTSPPATALRVLVADDEPLARYRIRQMLAAHHDIDVVSECCDGNEVLEMVEEVKPNLIFLDIQMPELGGFEALTRIGRSRQLAIIFVTAYETFARRAFDVDAVDYLVKPYSQQRFDTAMERARAFMAGRSRLAGTAGPSAAPRPSVERLTVRTRSEVFFIRTEDIFWIAAEENYARLHLAKGSHLIRESLQDLEKRLDPTAFVRVHRSAIVNITRLRKVVFHAAGCVVVLTNDTNVPVGARYRERFEQFLGEEL